ncbi:unnamed protein product [Miscanthus lutarioriparius]|uniref:Thiolase N-terminal domain-containing protein n=1 Tax=Miscanthus lutarioriparius TaxID=422564 RepID=A0A811NFP4_9POAL|nr:unnamed protein product [Miscanthus lutarioriparius]
MLIVGLTFGCSCTHKNATLHIISAVSMRSNSFPCSYMVHASNGSHFSVSGKLLSMIFLRLMTSNRSMPKLYTSHFSDAFAIQSNERGIAARDSGAFAWEIVPIEVPVGREKPPVLIEKDESLDKFDPAKLKKLRPSFKENGGTVTAGIASSISDGAVALVLVSGQKAQELGVQDLARIRGYADAAQCVNRNLGNPANPSFDIDT